MKIYTRTGDAGETGLLGGARVGKQDVRIEAFGTIDELNAVLGLARASQMPESIDARLANIQEELFVVGAELAAVDPRKLSIHQIGSRQVVALEAAIDHHEAQLPTLRQFILPGGTPAAAALHVARGVCRRAERRVTALRSGTDAEVGQILQYLNRLGDLLFVLARSANAAQAVADHVWSGGSNKA